MTLACFEVGGELDRAVILGDVSDQGAMAFGKFENQLPRRVKFIANEEINPDDLEGSDFELIVLLFSQAPAEDRTEWG